MGRRRLQGGEIAAGCDCAYISNGNGTPQVLDFIRPYVDAYKVDLKTFNDKHYRQLGGVLENVTDTIACSRARVLGRDRHPRRPRLQRLRRRPQAHGRFLASVSTAHAVAHDGVPPGLQDDGSRSDTGDDLLRASRSARPGPHVRLPRQPPGRRGASGRTRAARLRRDGHRASRFPRRREPASRRLVPEVLPRDPGPLGLACRGDQPHPGNSAPGRVNPLPSPSSTRSGSGEGGST